MEKPLRTLIIIFFVVALLLSCGVSKKTVRTAPEGVPLNEGVSRLSLSDMEKDVINRLNDLRAHPKEWADYLKGTKKGLFGIGLSSGNDEETAEAVLYLESRKPVPPLKLSRGLTLAAADLLKDHGPKGLTGHRASDGTVPADRMARYGYCEGKTGENLIYGYKDEDRLMKGILTEGGSRGWEQRNNVLSKDFNLVGIACGSHNVYGTMCVIDFAEKYEEMTKP